ncbi:uncharacterized protein LOC121244225 [Juglans microcarpa x Juglans regia]|uniref:uncharacterized protein LOC121244225 n=1 Tax=Juglans microcarpa x Juglans regia TaxID=2249226 RepID=UPI001B7E9573|nr:uncharacterized protein LOC121244225 [Juglans microcarpa x Juglans regia]
MVAFALVITARRLRPYFQAHPIKVQTNVCLRKILQKPDISGQMTSWAIELSEFEIKYLPRTSIKGLVLVDFVAEFSNFPEDVIVAPQGKSWQVYLNGSSCRTGGKAGVHIVTSSGERFDYALKLGFKVTNNEAEYEALLLGLTISRSLGATEVKVKADSQIVVGHVTGQFLTKGENLKRYLQRVGEEWDHFQYSAIHQIPRGENQEADRLAKAASGQEEVPFPDHVVARTVDIAAVGIQVRNRAAKFRLVETILYKRGYAEPLLRCLSSEQAQYVLAEIHEGVCGNHASGRALALRTAWAGYYWPNAHKDADEFARKCLKCQENALIPHFPPVELTSVTAPWPSPNGGWISLVPSQ